MDSAPKDSVPESCNVDYSFMQSPCKVSSFNDNYIHKRNNVVEYLSVFKFVRRLIVLMKLFQRVLEFNTPVNLYSYTNYAYTVCIGNIILFLIVVEKHIETLGI